MSGGKVPSELPRVLRRLIPLLAVFGLLWVVFDAAWKRYPYFKNGTEIIIEAKLGVVNSGSAFKESPLDAARVVVCGHSLVLSGFIPKLFDELSGGRTFSFNLGVPGQTGFDELEAVITRGTPPTHVFLQIPWKEEFEPTIWKWFKSDKPIIEKAFPFRSAPRDLSVFFALAPRKGGVQGLYEFGKDSAERMIRERGHFLIEANLYAGERVPDDFRHPDDTPDQVRPRIVHPNGTRFDRLRELADQNKVELYFIPGYIREGHAAEAPSINLQTAEEFKPYPRFHVIGPDYFRYPNRQFCDWVHVNDEGARRYTTDLWEVTKSLFTEPRRQASAPKRTGADAL